MTIGKAISASGPFFDIIDSKQPARTGLRDPDVSNQADILFRDVTFAYPTRPRMKVLRGIKTRFQRGKTTTLVGSSGSVKSIIAGLIESWYELQAMSESREETIRGEILVDDHNINHLDLKWWRSQIGLVQQEPFLFNDTVFNNVAFGLIGSKWENDPEAVKMDHVTKACDSPASGSYHRNERRDQSGGRIPSRARSEGRNVSQSCPRAATETVIIVRTRGTGGRHASFAERRTSVSWLQGLLRRR